MKRKVCLFLDKKCFLGFFVSLFLLNSSNTQAQKRQSVEYLLSGTVKEAETGKIVEGASILFSGVTVGTATDSAGNFRLMLPQRNYQLVVRMIGFKPKIEKIELTKNTQIEVLIERSEELLGEVVISTEKSDANVQRAIMGVEKLSSKTLKNLPTLMGEADVIRSIMLLPGVSTVGEGAAGFNVRGGNVDQNLVLLDGVPLFNTSHLFGFFTGFNADMVQEASLYKGGIPANYGGRSSSVLDVRLKEGSFDKFHLQGGVGPLSSRLLAEGPIIKDKTSLIIGARGSFSDFYLKFFDNPNLQESNANFYDLNGKLTHRFGNNQRISLASYVSYDDFKFASDTVYFWRTQNVSLRHNALIARKLSHNFTAFINNYSYGVEGIKQSFEFLWKPAITQKSIKEALNYQFSDKSEVNIGAEFDYFINDMGSLVPNAERSIIEKFWMPKEQTKNLAYYAEHRLQISKQLSFDYGLRHSFYQLVGPAEVYNYDKNKPREVDTITGTTSYVKGQAIKKYNGLEPRLSMAVRIDSTFSVKIGANRMRQYMQLLSNTMAISPTDIWKNSNEVLPPLLVDQFSLGFFKNFQGATNSTLETSVEVYYKNLQNIIDYVDGATIYLNPMIESQLLVGKGYSYGAEFFIKKPRGKKLTGWLSYTYSRSFRLVEANENQTAANFGLRFPTNFDTPHNVKFVLNNRLTNRIAFNANFTYNTGRPITYPNGKYKLYAYNDVFNYMLANGLNPRDGLLQRTYEYNGTRYTYLVQGEISDLLDGYAAPSYTLRNAERIPDYIRLDIGMTLSPKIEKKYKSSWNFSIYNVLSRSNVYSIYFRSSTGLRNLARTYQLSVLGAAIPSLTYNFEF